MSAEAASSVVSPAPAAGIDELVIETPERVELYYTRAHVGNRFLAAGVDHLLQVLMIAAVGLGVYLAGGLFERIWAGLGQWAIAIAIMASFAIYTAYFAVFETIWSGQTPGKRLFRLRVIREDGRPIRLYEALLRNLLRTFVDAMPILGAPLYSVGILSIFLSSRSKRVGDYVAGTVVIRESEAKAPTLDEVISLARTEANRVWAKRDAGFSIDPRSLTAADVEALRAFLRRRYDLPDTIRASLANRIAMSLATRLAIPAVPLAPEQLLEEIDRQARARRRYDGDLG